MVEQASEATIVDVNEFLVAFETPDINERADVISHAAHVAEPEALVEALGDHENSIRRNAAMQALAEGGARSVPALIRALRHPDSDVVLFAVNVLGRTRDRSAIAHLIPLLENSNLNVAQAAIETLANLRASVAVDALVATLRRDAWLQVAAIHALGEIGSPRSVQALAMLLTEEGLRDAVVTALGRIGGREALDILAKRLREPLDAESFVDCLKALGELLDRHPDEATLGSVAAWAALGAAESLQVQNRLGKLLTSDAGDVELELKRAAAAIVRALKIRSLYLDLMRAGEDVQLRERLRFCAASIGKDLEPTILQALQDPNARVRAFATECAGTLGCQAAIPRLVAMLSEPHTAVQAGAIGALSRLQHLPAIPAFVELLGNESPSVADAAENALSRFPPEIVAQSVPWDMSRGDRLVRILAIAAKCPHATQQPLLLTSLHDGRSSVRQAAVTALAAQRLPETPSIMAPMLADSSGLVRIAAFEALGQSRTERSRELLLEQLAATQDIEERVHVVNALAEQEEPALVPPLLALIDSPHRALRIAIARAVVRLDRVAAEPALVPLLADPDPRIRASVVRSLATLPSPTILSYLIAAARDPETEVRAAVAESLPVGRPEQEGQEGGAHAALERLSIDTDASVSVIAQERLRRIAAPRVQPTDHQTVRPPESTTIAFNS